MVEGASQMPQSRASDEVAPTSKDVVPEVDPVAASAVSASEAFFEASPPPLSASGSSSVVPRGSICTATLPSLTHRQANDKLTV